MANTIDPRTNKSNLAEHVHETSIKPDKGEHLSSHEQTRQEKEFEREKKQK